MPRKPYNPAKSGPQQTQVHDRRARQVNRGLAAHLVESEVDDPYEAGAKIGVLRSVRDDPLGDRFARGHIDQAQFEAGRQFQEHFRIAERGPRTIQMRERIDGNPPHENLTDRQIIAGKWLTRCYRELGADGSAIVHAALISNMTCRQIATSRGMAGPEWPRYFARRLAECLDCLALVYGLAGRRSPGGLSHPDEKDWR